MANNIEQARKDIQAMLDLIYTQESVTSILQANPNLVQEVNGAAGSIRIAKRTVDGYGDYGRQNSGNAYPSGDVSLTWETHDMSVDRGVSLTVDRMDDDESGMNAFNSIASLAGQLEREKGAPEMDAYRFAKMTGTAGILEATADLTSSTIKGAIDTAISAMDDANVPAEGRVLFMVNAMYNALKNSDFFTYNLESNAANGGIDTRVATYDGMRVVKVNQDRFYSAIELNDGSSSFGYGKAAGGVNLNFMIVHPSAIIPVVKLANVKYFTPDTNQNGDSHLVQARKFYDLFVLENKVEGIYAHKATA